MPKDTLAARTAQRRMGRRPRRWEPGDARTAQNVTVSAGPLAALAGGAGAAAGAMDAGAGLAASVPSIPYDGATNMSVGNPMRGNINLGSFAGPRMNPEFDPTKPLAEMGSPYQPTTGVGGFFRRLVGDNSNALNKQFAAQRSGLMLQEAAENRALMAQQAEAQAQFKQQEALKRMEIEAERAKYEATNRTNMSIQEADAEMRKRVADSQNYLQMQDLLLRAQQGDANAKIALQQLQAEANRPTIVPQGGVAFTPNAALYNAPYDQNAAQIAELTGQAYTGGPKKLPFGLGGMRQPLANLGGASNVGITAPPEYLQSNEMYVTPEEMVERDRIRGGGMPPQSGLAAPQTGPKAPTVADGAGAPDGESRTAPPITQPMASPSSSPNTKRGVFVAGIPVSSGAIQETAQEYGKAGETLAKLALRAVGLHKRTKPEEYPLRNTDRYSSYRTNW